MVDYDIAAAAVQDPNVDPAFLARIAYENPEFGACVAANQRAYPGLLAWLAEFGTPEAKEWVAKRANELPVSARMTLAAINSSTVNPSINPAFSNMTPGSPVQQFTYEQSIQQQPYGYVEQQRSVVTEQPQMAFSSPAATPGINSYANVMPDSQAMQAGMQGMPMQQSIIDQQSPQAAASSNGMYAMQQPGSASPVGTGVAGVTAMPTGTEGIQQPQQHFADIASAQQPQQVQASVMQQPAVGTQPVQQQPMVQPQMGIQGIQQPAVNAQQPMQQQQQAAYSAIQAAPAQQAQANLVATPQDAAMANPLQQSADNGSLVVNGYTSEQALTVADPMVQRDIAVKAPALDPYLLQNPSLYPELRQWLENRQNK